MRDLAPTINPYLGRRYVLTFSFRGDLSYDNCSPDGGRKGVSYEPKTYVFAGLFGESTVWDGLEAEWKSINQKYGVDRFHAAHLNGKTHEYSGWDDPRKRSYSKELLEAIELCGSQLEGVSCGVFADEYRRIISEDGRRKLGSPYLLCFNSCIALLATSMDKAGFPKNARFSVLIDKDDSWNLCVDSFFWMKECSPFSSRLGLCSPAAMSDLASMQAADLLAYEVFKRLHASRNKPDGELRFPMRSLIKNNNATERYFSGRTLRSLKEQIESTPSPDGRLIVIPSS